MEKKIKNEIIVWNNMFPIDRWFREKYKIPFLSKKHLESNFIDQYFEYKEDEMFRNLEEKEKYESNTGAWLKTEYVSKKVSLEQLIEEGRKEMKNFKME